MSGPDNVCGMGSKKGRMMLFSPKVFQVGMSGNSDVGIGVHAGKMGNEKGVGKANGCVDSSRRRVQTG